MNISDFEVFLKERMRAYDPECDLSDGSPAVTQVIDPIINRFTPDPLNPDLKKFCLTRIRQEYPQHHATEGSALADLLIKPMQILLEPFRREILDIKNQLSLAYPDQLNKREADDLVFNIFVRRNSGDYARVKVRIYFTNPLSVTISSANYAYTATGLRFLPEYPQSITSESMLFNQDSSGLYYFDINYVSESPGQRYKLNAGDIIGVTNVTAATRATNLYKAVGGVDEESTPKLISRGEKSIGERSFTTVNGSVAKLFEEFSELSLLQIVGFNDSDMQRDVIVGGSLGPILYYGFDGACVDDGSSSDYTYYFDSASGDFTERFGPVSYSLAEYTLSIFYPGIEGGPKDFRLGSILGSTRISIHSDYTNDNRLPRHLTTNLYWTIRKSSVISLSNVPEGIMFPDELAETTEIPTDTIHIGGCTDYYIRGGDIENASLVVQLVSDESTLFSGYEAETTEDSDSITLSDISDDDFESIELLRNSIVLETGTNSGSYRILEKTTPNIIRIQVDASIMVDDNNISYSIVDDLDIDLLEPKNIKYVGNNLKTYLGLAVVSTTDGLPDFDNVGVVDGDFVKIINGNNRGEYAIVPGGISGNELILETVMTNTESPLNFKVYSKGGGIDLPLLRVVSVELLDSSLNPRGEFIPYRNPIDIRSRSFQNPSRGAKVGTIVYGIEDYISTTVDEDIVESSETINYFELGVREGDLVNIESSDNQGFYTVTEVGGDPSAPTLSALPKQLRLDRNLMWPATNMEYKLGEPSIGSFRVYFLEPCTFEVNSSTIFSVTLDNGSTYNFRPDPSIYLEYLPNSSVESLCSLTNANPDIELYEKTSLEEIDVYRYKSEIGDKVEITHAPIVGAINLATASLNLDNKTLLIDIGNGIETVKFTGTSLNIDAIISQINNQLSVSIAEKYIRTSSPAGTYLKLQYSGSLILHGTGTATASLFDDGSLSGNSRTRFMAWLTGDFFGNATDNDSPEKGIYYIAGINDKNELELQNADESLFSPGYTIISELGHYCRFSKLGVQRISSTQMVDNIDENYLYYFDVECISEGYGDAWNINADQKAYVTNFYSEGWSISVDNENLSFSMAEKPWINISPRVLITGVDDDPANYLELSALNVQINYERLPLIVDVHNYSRNKSTRVTNQNPLVRSLLPTFIRSYITYKSGPTSQDAKKEIVQIIEDIIPSNNLQLSDIVNKLKSLGASYIKLPINVLAISHKIDRSIDVTRTQDILDVGKVSMLVADDNNTTAEGAYYIVLNRTV